MPINIYSAENHTTIEFLCDDNWSLATQLHELEKWLATKEYSLPKGNYIADIGFSIQSEANGGGSVINSNMIKMLANTHMELFLSEYPIGKKV